jgi:hypothetical protein
VVEEPPVTLGGGDVPKVVDGRAVVVVVASRPELTVVVVDDPAPAVVVEDVGAPGAEVVVLSGGVGEGWPTLKNTAWGLPIGVAGLPTVAA